MFIGYGNERVACDTKSEKTAVLAYADDVSLLLTPEDEVQGV
jgi:hypothetical protein